jgi:hypothetical protein
MLCSTTERKRGVTMIDLDVELKLDIQALQGLRDRYPGTSTRSEDA